MEFLIAHLELIVWTIAGAFVLAGLFLMYLQYQTSAKLKSELGELSKVKKHNVEYELVLKAMKLCTWRIDVPTRTITYESDFRDKVDNYTPAPGTPIREVGKMYTDEYRHRVMSAMNDLIEGRVEEFHEQYRVKIPRSNHSYWSEGFATVSERDGQGKPLVIVGTTMRIDDRKRMENAIITARNQAEEANRLKSAFLANISHEIRTPLNAIVGFSEVLPMVQEKAERENLMALIKENNAKLLTLIDDMVSMSKVESGTANILKTSFDLNIILHEVSNNYQSQLHSDTVVVQTRFPQETCTIMTDRQKLTEIVNHYMTNALKFTRRGSVTLGYDPVKNGKIRIWVQDTGKGIPESELDRIFERFVKLDEFIQGTGLGLSLCRSIAYSLNGNVGVESKVDAGSLFWVELPAGDGE